MCVNAVNREPRGASLDTSKHQQGSDTLQDGYEDGGHLKQLGTAPPAPAAKLRRSVGLFCHCGMSVMLGMPTLMPRGPSLLAAPDKAAEQRQFPRVLPPPLHPGPCRPPLLALLCNSHGRPAAQQREAFILGHKAHQIQLFWKG